MKAKDWVVKFEASLQEGASENVSEVLKAFGLETAELVGLRTKASNPESRFPAAEGAVREQKAKFRSICSRVSSLTESMFDPMIASAIPEYDTWKKAATKKKVEEKKDDVKDYRQNRKYQQK